MDNKIDIVILYVNPNDSNFQNSIKQYITEFDSQKFRYNRLFLLKYILRSIDLYFDKNILGDIYIVVSNKSEIPDDLTNINIITHDEIIPKQYLPLFNSCSIELFINNIPTLREHFVYLNDDMLCNSNVTYDLLYTNNNLPVISYIKSQINEQTQHIEYTNYQRMLNNAYNICAIECNKNQIDNKDNYYYNPNHQMTPMIKSANLYLYNKYYDKFINSLSKFRSTTDLSQHVFNYYHFLKNGNIFLSKQTAYFDVNEYYLKNLENTLNNTNIVFICISVNESTPQDFNKFNELKNMIHNLLDIKFPNKSKYEK